MPVYLNIEYLVEKYVFIFLLHVNPQALNSHENMKINETTPILHFNLATFS